MSDVNDVIPDHIDSMVSLSEVLPHIFQPSFLKYDVMDSDIEAFNFKELMGNERGITQ